jgi:hypothetical protein
MNLTDLCARLAVLNLSSSELQDLLNSATDLSKTPDDPCASMESGTTSFHIGAIFTVIAASLLGAVLPLLLRTLPASAVDFPILMGKCFGSGVLVSTGLIHMLKPGVDSFSSPCFPPSAMESYNAWPYAIATAGILVMQAFEVSTVHPSVLPECAYLFPEKRFSNFCAGVQVCRNE